MGCTASAPAAVMNAATGPLCLTDAQLDAALKKFEQFDADNSGFIEAKELDGLKRLFSMEQLDVGVQDGKVSEEELVAALYHAPHEVAKSALAAYKDRRALAKRLQDEVGPAMAKFEQFDKDGSGSIDASEFDGLKKLFSFEGMDSIKHGASLAP